MTKNIIYPHINVISKIYLKKGELALSPSTNPVYKEMAGRTLRKLIQKLSKLLSTENMPRL